MFKKILVLLRDIVIVFISAAFFALLFDLFIILQEPIIDGGNFGESTEFVLYANKLETHLEVLHNNNLYDFNMKQIVIYSIMVMSAFLLIALVIVYIVNLISRITAAIRNKKYEKFYKENFEGEENLPDYGPILAIIIYKENWRTSLGFDVIGIIQRRILKYYKKENKDFSKEKALDELEQRFLDICEFEKSMGKDFKAFLENQQKLAEMKLALDVKITNILKKKGYIVAHKKSNLSLSYFVLTDSGKREYMRLKYLAQILLKKDEEDLRENEKLFLSLI